MHYYEKFRDYLEADDRAADGKRWLSGEIIWEPGEKMKNKRVT